MRVLLATPWLHPAGGGLERYAASIGGELARQGHEVTLLGHAREPRDETGGGVRVLGVPPRRVLSNTPLSMEVHRVARRLFREERFDVVNAHTPVPGTAELVALAARRARVPHVVTYHAGTLGAPRGALSLAARVHALLGERWMLRSARERVAVSPFVAARVFRALGADVVPPGVDTRTFHPQGEPMRGRILFVGPVSRAYAWKGFGVLADAYERLAERLPEAHMRVVGAGDLVDAYRDRFAGKPVSFLSRLDDAELAREYSRASVIVLPSVTHAESFGMCLAEANACARPVVASAVGGIPSFVRDGENGILVPPGEPEALAAALERVLTDPAGARAMGARGRARVEREHRWDALAQRTADILERAVTGASGRAPRRTRA